MRSLALLFLLLLSIAPANASALGDWYAWRNRIEQHRSFDPPTVDVERKIIDIKGEIVQGFLTVEIGYFAPDGTYYPSYSRQCSIAIPEEHRAKVDALLSLTISDADLDALAQYAYASQQVRDMWDGKHQEVQ
jgi:hypothetical protein